MQGQNPPDPFQVDPCTFAIPFDPNNCQTPPPANFRAAVNGAFKTPGLRNVELTGPYMHNGSMATLEQVVQFYNRGGNFENHPGNQVAITAQQPGLGTNLGADDSFTIYATGKFGAGNLVPFTPAP
jgi:hypothetical protein